MIVEIISLLSDFDNMINNGFKRFWDCGSNVYEWIGK